MAKKRKRRPRGATGGGPTARPADRAAATEKRQQRKEEARRLREAERRRIRRRAILRRAGIGAAVGVAVLGGILLFRSQLPGSIPEEARAAAEAAGCSGVSSPVDSPARGHGGAGEPITYDQRPATSGRHDPSPLPPEPKVSDQPIPESRAVHNLEHAYVIVYYRADGEQALPEAVVERLTSLVQVEDKVLMAPYPELPDGASLALAAWNKLQTCPSTIEADQAAEVASGFIEAFRGTSNAPEASAG